MNSGIECEDSSGIFLPTILKGSQHRTYRKRFAPDTPLTAELQNEVLRVDHSSADGGHAGGIIDPIFEGISGLRDFEGADGTRGTLEQMRAGRRLFCIAAADILETGASLTANI